MTKRIVISIALLLFPCLVITGCGQSNNVTESGEANNEDETSIVEPGDSTDPASTSEPDNTASFDESTDKTPSVEYDHDSSPADVTIGDGKYSYSVWIADICMDTNIDDYINGNVFRFTDLAYDLGWHVRHAEDKDNPDVSRFFIDDDNKYYVGFSTLETHVVGGIKSHDYAWICFTMPDCDGINIGFNRSDLDGDGITYTVNEGGRTTASRAQVIFIAYLLESQLTYGYDDLFEQVLPRGVETNYFISE